MSIWEFVVITIGLIGIYTGIGVLALSISLHESGRPPIWKRQKQKPPTAEEILHQARVDLRVVPEDLEWMEEQARIAGFEIPTPPTPQQIRKDRKLVQMTGGSPVLFPTETGLLEINGTWYEKWINDKGSYLKEVAAPRAQEEVHEESTIVRDITGRHIAYYRLNTGS